MKDLLVLLVHLLTMVARLLGPGGARAVVAENLLIKQQLIVVSCSRRRAPNLTTLDRFVLGFCSLFIHPDRIDKAAVAIRPSTLLGFHECLVRRKYRALFSSRTKAKPGPTGPSEELIHVIVGLKRRNPRFGCPRIALIITKTFGVERDKDVVRRVLARHYRPKPDGGGPSWLGFADNAVRWLEGSEDACWFWLFSGDSKVLVVFGGLNVLMLFFYRSRIGQVLRQPD
jgi:hypothetical protein